MPGGMQRLSAVEVARHSKAKIDKIRSWHDGGGLYFILDGRRSNGGAASANWVYRYTFDCKARMLGLGPYPLISLSDARQGAAEARRLKAHGQDPLLAKRAERAARQVESDRAVTFESIAEEFMRSNRATWKNAKHAAQWASTLKTYAYPLIGGEVVGAVSADALLGVLRQPVSITSGKSAPLWEAKPETASRLRGRIEAVLDYAKFRGLREGDNPAAWRGNLKMALPAKAKFAKVKHHAAIDVDMLAALIGDLRPHEGLSARALEFTILTAARTSEVLGAKWSEIDLAAKMWTIPEGRMKAGREHRVPLSQPALDLLDRVKPVDLDADAYVFPGTRPGKPLSNMSMLMLLRRMGRGDLTAHGFRSTFRDWVSERTNFPGELAEMALAHAVADKVEAAYRRGDQVEKRRPLMEAWGAFCAAQPHGNVTALHPAGIA